MTKFSAAISNDQSIHAALELSKNSWLLAIQVPGRDNPSQHPIKGGDADGLMAKLDAARQRVAKATGRTPTVALSRSSNCRRPGRARPGPALLLTAPSWARVCLHDFRLV